MIEKIVLMVDHYQFYVEGIACQADTSTLWDNKNSIGMLAVAPGLVGVGIARYGGAVSSIVEVLNSRPAVNFDEWDQVAECSIEISSGCIVVYSPETDRATAPRIDAPAGIYRAFMCYGNLDSVEDDSVEQGDDLYKIMLWLGSNTQPTVLKHR